MSFDRVVPQGTGTAKPAAAPAKTSPSAMARPDVTIRPMTARPLTPAADAPSMSGSSSTRSKGSSMPSSVSPKLFVSLAVLTLVFGAVTGFAGAYMTRPAGPIISGGTGVTGSTAAEVDSALKVGAVFGVPDEKAFRDDTEGVLIIGGIEGEGSHTLLRAGGVSQNVYLTSSVVDLDQFEGMKLRIWGETFKGQKAGWLMDVGRVEVLELKAEFPDWYKAE